jgi:amino acid transporter
MGRVLWRVKRFLVGQPIPTAQESQERLNKIRALAVLSSDALSSVAYGTEAAMRALILAGVGALALTMPISVVIALLLIIVATSYQQTIQGYPSGGGSYIVAHENLGQLPGLTAAAALLVDYVLTVAVSTAAGVAALVSAFPALGSYDVALAVGAVLLITLLNLRGVRESGTIFAIPTYVFVLSILGLIGFGLFRLVTGGIPYLPGPAGPAAGTQPLTWFLILSAFAKGCTAMTGTEAISNVVPVFKPPEVRNARITLGLMAGLLAVMFVGISFLASYIGIIPDPTENETVLSQLTRLISGQGPYYYLVQFSTTLILVLAANTSYASFPRLLYVMARDRYVPRWFGLRGDRLAFTTGIATLALFSIALLVIFGSNVERLLPLYAIGVFTGFTLSQSGMVLHWLRGTEPDRKRKAVINGVGAAATAVVAVVIAVTKFLEGAWIVILIAPMLILLFLAVHGHYVRIAQQLRTRMPVKPRGTPPLVLVPISSLSLVARKALALAQDLSPRVAAVHVTPDLAEAEGLRKEWPEVAGELPLIIIESPYRLLLAPLLAYVDAVRESYPDDTLLVVLPEFVPRHWWENLLHNQTALRLKASLLFRSGVAVTSFPYQLEE